MTSIGPIGWNTCCLEDTELNKGFFWSRVHPVPASACCLRISPAGAMPTPPATGCPSHGSSPHGTNLTHRGSHWPLCLRCPPQWNVPTHRRQVGSPPQGGLCHLSTVYDLWSPNLTDGIWDYTMKPIMDAQGGVLRARERGNLIPLVPRCNNFLLMLGVVQPMHVGGVWDRNGLVYNAYVAHLLSRGLYYDLHKHCRPNVVDLIKAVSALWAAAWTMGGAATRG